MTISSVSRALFVRSCWRPRSAPTRRTKSKGEKETKKKEKGRKFSSFLGRQRQIERLCIGSIAAWRHIYTRRLFCVRLGPFVTGLFSVLRVAACHATLLVRAAKKGRTSEVVGNVGQGNCNDNWNRYRSSGEYHFAEWNSPSSPCFGTCCSSENEFPSWRIRGCSPLLVRDRVNTIWRRSNFVAAQFRTTLILFSQIVEQERVCVFENVGLHVCVLNTAEDVLIYFFMYYYFICMYKIQYIYIN